MIPIRKRLILAPALGIAAVAAAATAALAVGPGPNGNTQDMTAKIQPQRLHSDRFDPVRLNVTTDTASTTAANGVPVPASRAVIDFDRNARIFNRGLPTCSPSKILNQSTDAARAACKSAIVGTGKAQALIPVGTRVFTEDVTVTAFNGVPQGRKPVILLHTFGSTPAQVSIVLTGVVSNFNKQGFGPRLDVAIPALAGGTGALTHFEVSVKRLYKFKKKRRSFISAKCVPKKGKKRGTLRARGTFTYLDGQSLTVKVSQNCTAKKSKKSKKGSKRR